MTAPTTPHGTGEPRSSESPSASPAVTPVKSYGAHGSGSRTRVALACSECEARNYQTTRKAERQGQLTLKKFCPSCNRHTVHKETK